MLPDLASCSASSAECLARLRQRLQAQPEITAICTHQDRDAQKVVAFLEMNGYRVPEDISVVGFEDTHAVMNAVGQNRLTTVASPLAEIGAEAARLALRLLAGEPVIAGQVLTLPVHLLVRGTTGPARSHGTVFK